MRAKVWFQCVGLFLTLFAVMDRTAPASAQSRSLIQFDRNAPEILAFRRINPGGESVVGGVKVPSLALPVMDFTYPAVLGLGGFESATPTVREIPVFDPRDPTTYTVRHRYADVDITVSGDLNYQGAVTGDAPLLPKDGILVEAARPGEPPIARVTVQKFGIPYVIDVECGEAHASLCRSEGQLRDLGQRLALVSVPK